MTEKTGTPARNERGTIILGIRKYDVCSDIGRTNKDIVAISTAFAEGIALWIDEKDVVYDAKRRRIGRASRIVFDTTEYM